MSARVLVIDDNPRDVQRIRETMRGFPESILDLQAADSLIEGFRRLDRETFDAILLDLALPDCSGIETLRKARLAAPELPIVVLVGRQDVELPLEAVRSGAQDYLVKGAFDAMLLTRTIRHAIERMRALRDLLESDQRYRTLYEQVDSAILELSTDGEATSANPALLRMLEYEDSADVIGLDAGSQMFCDSGEFRAFIEQAKRGIPQHPCELSLHIANGRKIVASCRIHEIRLYDGQLIGYQILLKAITKRPS